MCSKKFMYDVLHMGTLKKFDDEDQLNESVDGVVKIDVEGVKDEKRPETNLPVWNENIVILISMILPKGSRSKAHDFKKVLLRK